MLISHTKSNSLRNPLLSFKINTSIIFGLAIFNILYKLRINSMGIYVAENLWNPTWLLFGPFIYFTACTLTNQKGLPKAVLHFIPFFIFAGFFCYNFPISLQTDCWSHRPYIWYQNSYLVIPISLLSYSLIIVRAMKFGFEQKRVQMLYIVIGLFMLISILYLLIYLYWGVLQINMGIDYRFFTYALLLIIGIVIGRFAYLEKTDVTSISEEKDHFIYTNSALKSSQVEGYIAKIESYFIEKKPYLNSNLSLNMLAKELNIPEYQFSQILNVHIGKNFYNYVASFRIKYAIEQIENGQNKFTIESLAYDCGFNSKTSFNKYFKELLGVTPLEYLKGHQADNSFNLPETI